LVIWGAVWGGIQAASRLAFWWLDASTVYALGLVLIASVYIGFAVADGRAAVIKGKRPQRHRRQNGLLSRFSGSSL
jgi:hypothetical protein